MSTLTREKSTPFIKKVSLSQHKLINLFEQKKASIFPHQDLLDVMNTEQIDYS